MTCPLCSCKEQISIDLHAEGFSQNACECGACGCIWTISDRRLIIIKGPDQPLGKAYANFFCPTCHSATCIETDLDAFQFHEEIYECSNCGTVCSSSHNQIDVVKDSQSASFLSSTSDLVEAHDYVFV